MRFTETCRSNEFFVTTTKKKKGSLNLNYFFAIKIPAIFQEAKPLLRLRQFVEKKNQFLKAKRI